MMQEPQERDINIALNGPFLVEVANQEQAIYKNVDIQRHLPHCQSSSYKNLSSVSFIGMDPYIQYNEDSVAYGGAEFVLIDTYAKAYGFTPKLRREPTYDSSTWQANGEGEYYVRGPVPKVGY